MPPTPHCWAAAGWTGPFIGPAAPRSWQSAGKSAAAPPARPASPPAATSRPVTSSTPWGRFIEGGGRREAELLASCYRESLKLASGKGLTSVAFPSISTGAYGYPLAEAARVALKTVMDYLSQHPEIKLARFVLFGHPAYETYEKTLRDLLRVYPGAREL